jgi:hypothetical protein
MPKGLALLELIRTDQRVQSVIAEEEENEKLYRTLRNSRFLSPNDVVKWLSLLFRDVPSSNIGLGTEYPDHKRPLC